MIARRKGVGVWLALLAVHATPATAQTPSVTPAQPPAISLADAQAAARGASASLRAAREAVAAARARARQAGVLQNPTLSYGREQTSRGGQANAQDIAQLEQPLELGGQRGARRHAARLRSEAAEARLDAVGRDLDFEVARAYATLAAATRRATLADEATAVFAEAGRVTSARLAAGDVSGYATRRLQLETARYAAQRAEAALTLRVARVELASLLMVEPDSLRTPPIATLLPAGGGGTRVPRLDSLLAVASDARPELRALALEAAAASADARVATAERVPTPTLSAGYKRESVDPGDAGGAVGLHGFVAGFSLPLPVFDRRRGSIESATAETRRLEADVDALRRRLRLDVAREHAAVGAADAQVELLRAQLGESARVALRAVQAAYTEGEITLVEWLDAVRAYQEAESTLATLQADALIRRAALERAVGAPLFPRSTR